MTKICLVGEFSVGKSSLVRRFVESAFDERYLSTIGVHISRREIKIGAVELKLLIWDTAGSEGFGQVVQNYYRGAAGALLICDLTRAETLTALPKYADAFQTANPGASFVVVANKADLLAERKIDNTALAAFAEERQVNWICTSARTGVGVEQAFLMLGQQILQRRGSGYEQRRNP